MKIIFVAYKYLKRRPALTVLILSSIMVSSFFEGASFGMLIPLIQSMTLGTIDLFEKIPPALAGRLNLIFISMSQPRLISFVFIFMLGILIIKNIFAYLSSTLISKLRFGSIRDFRTSLMDNLLEYDMSFFDSVKTGHIINNINIETMRMGDFIFAVLQFVVLSGKALAYLLLLFLISWKLSIAILLLITSVLIPIELITKKVKKIGTLVSQAYNDFNSKLTELLNGIRLIKGCTTEEMEKKNFKLKADNLYNLPLRADMYLNSVIPLSEVFIFALIILFFLVLMRVTELDIKNTFPVIATYLVVLVRLLTQLNTLNSRRSTASYLLPAFEYYEQLFDETNKKKIKSGDMEITKFSDSIEFRGVNFSYTTGKQVLTNINIKIPKGKITAFVGASGTGKSTIINLIARFYDVSAGEILIDNINLKSLILKRWRRKIGFVSQDVFIFNTDVKNNISYRHPDVGEEEIIKAAKVANAHDFIINLPDGYNSVLGERGVKLSGGQKQRIAIARAIIDNPEILILDEATSSLDTETEKLITEAIDRLTKDRTVMAIAHRLSTILHADNIIVLDEGRVIECGRHIDLYRKNGLYRRLYDAQFAADEKVRHDSSYINR